MGEVLAETLETVENQRLQYEQKLVELEELLNQARSKAVESEMNSNEKAVLVRQLETEKQVISNVFRYKWCGCYSYIFVT
jgi:hypothetical protein